VKASGTVGSYKSQVRGGSKLSCQRAPELIHLYIDEELDRLQASEFRQHLDQCKDCDVLYQNQLALRFALKQNSLYYRASHDLLRQVRSALREEVDAEAKVRPAAQTLSPGDAMKKR
jgi:anti-sigma factor RsiW